MRPCHYLFITVAAGAITAASLWGLNHRLMHRSLSTHQTVEQKIATAVAANQNVLLPPGVNEPVLRWDTAERLSAAPDIVLFGSSHGLRISSQLFAPRHIANFSISGGSLADHLITTELLESRKLRPRAWVIMVEAWFFDRDTDFGAWRARAGELDRMQARLDNLESSPLRPVYQAASAPRQRASYSLDPLLASLDATLRDITETVTTTDRTDLSAELLLADGSLQPAPERRQTTAEEARQLALRQFAGNADRQRYGSYRQIDRGLWQLFERWLQFCQQDNAEVWLVFPPFHPAIYPKIIQHPDNRVRSIEARVRALARQTGAHVVGSFDPARAGALESDFYDGDHLQEIGLKRLLTPLTSSLAAAANESPPATGPKP